MEDEKKQDMCVINDPLGQTHNPASTDYYNSHLKIDCFVL